MSDSTSSTVTVPPDPLPSGSPSSPSGLGSVGSESGSITATPVTTISVTATGSYRGLQLASKVPDVPKSVSSGASIPGQAGSGTGGLASGNQKPSVLVPLFAVLISLLVLVGCAFAYRRYRIRKAAAGSGNTIINNNSSKKVMTMGPWYRKREGGSKDWSEDGIPELCKWDVRIQPDMPIRVGAVQKQQPMVVGAPTTTLTPSSARKESKDDMWEDEDEDLKVPYWSPI